MWCASWDTLSMEGSTISPSSRMTGKNQDCLDEPYPQHQRQLSGAPQTVHLSAPLLAKVHVPASGDYAKFFTHRCSHLCSCRQLTSASVERRAVPKPIEARSSSTHESENRDHKASRLDGLGSVELPPRPPPGGEAPCLLSHSRMSIISIRA